MSDEAVLIAFLAVVAINIGGYLVARIFMAVVNDHE